MSEESAPPSKTPATPSEAGASSRVRRISNPRPKKVAKPASAAPSAPVSSESAPQAGKFPEFPESVGEGTSRNDWPEPEAASSGASSSSENPKRKRRRKKGKGNAAQNTAPLVDSDSPPQPRDESAEPTPVQAPRQNQSPRIKIDAEMLAKCAWKIYLAEISEEGVALVGDNDAKELSRRCFRLAEIFMEEQARRR